MVLKVFGELIENIRCEKGFLLIGPHKIMTVKICLLYIPTEIFVNYLVTQNKTIQFLNFHDVSTFQI